MIFNRKCKITFISHGATICSDNNALCETENYPPLNEIGQQEVENICEFLKRRAIKNDKVYTSPSFRTTQTADAVAKLFKKDFEVIEGLHTLKKSEKLDTFNSKVNKIISSLVEKNKGNRIIVVTYPEVIQSAIASALGISEENQHRVYIKTGSATQISYFEDWSSLVYSDYVPQ